MKPHELITTSNLHPSAGIYMILCIPANKAYIGQSKNIKRRWAHHRNRLKANEHGNRYLQNLYNKYGKDSFYYVVLENCANLTEREAYYVLQLDNESRINLAAIADIFPISEETKSKSKISPQCREAARIVNKNRVSSLKGVPLTQEHKMKVSIAHTGKALSEEHKRKISEAKKRLGVMPPSRKGKVLSEEHKKKISDSIKEVFSQRRLD